MNSRKPITEKVTDAITKAADTVKHAVEDFADAAAKAPDPMFLPNNDPFLGSPMEPMLIPPVPSKRAVRKRTKPRKKKAKKAAQKKIIKKAVRKSKKKSTKKRNKRRL
ncbi:MAG TPA: hypothetical protein VIJ46_06450 [Rhabdochlamydiaceae bacterium]